MWMLIKIMKFIILANYSSFEFCIISKLLLDFVLKCRVVSAGHVCHCETAHVLLFCKTSMTRDKYLKSTSKFIRGSHQTFFFVPFSC